MSSRSICRALFVLAIALLAVGPLAGDDQDPIKPASKLKLRVVLLDFEGNPRPEGEFSATFFTKENQETISPKRLALNKVHELAVPADRHLLAISSPSHEVLARTTIVDLQRDGKPLVGRLRVEVPLHRDDAWRKEPDKYRQVTSRMNSNPAAHLRAVEAQVVEWAGSPTAGDVELEVILQSAGLGTINFSVPGLNLDKESIPAELAECTGRRERITFAAIIPRGIADGRTTRYLFGGDKNLPPLATLEEWLLMEDVRRATELRAGLSAPAVDEFITSATLPTGVYSVFVSTSWSRSALSEPLWVVEGRTTAVDAALINAPSVKVRVNGFRRGRSEATALVGATVFARLKFADGTVAATWADDAQTTARNTMPSVPRSDLSMSAVTDEHGDAMFVGLPRAGVELLAFFLDYAGEPRRTDALTDTIKNVEIDLYRDPHELTITMTSPDGRPISGVRLVVETVSNIPHEPIHRVVAPPTDKRGQTLAEIGPGRWRITYAGMDYAPIRTDEFRILHPGKSSMSVVGEARVPVEFRFLQNGIANPNAKFRLRPLEPEPIPRGRRGMETILGELDGVEGVLALWPGRFLICDGNIPVAGVDVSRGEGFRFIVHDERHLVRGRVNDVSQLLPKAGASIGLTLTMIELADGFSHPDDRRDGSLYRFHTTLDRDGRFSFEPVPPGLYRLSHHGQSLSSSQRTIRVPDESSGEILLTLLRRGDGELLVGPRNDKGMPVANAKIRVAGEYGYESVMEVHRDDQGNAVWSYLPWGEYRVDVAMEDGVAADGSTTMYQPASVFAEVGTKLRFAKVDLLPAGSIDIQCNSADGWPVEGASISLWNFANNDMERHFWLPATRTNGRGRFRWSGLEPGQYSIQLQRGGWQSERVPVNVEKNVATLVSFSAP